MAGAAGSAGATVRGARGETMFWDPLVGRDWELTTESAGELSSGPCRVRVRGRVTELGSFRSQPPS